MGAVTGRRGRHEGRPAGSPRTQETSSGRAARRRANRLPPPLPQRDGLDPVRWQLPPDAPRSTPALDALQQRFPALADPAAAPLAQRFAAGEIVDARGRAWSAGDPVGPRDEMWFHRELPQEEVAEVELRILHRDEHLLVLDKPHDIATIPRGVHVLGSALIRLRRATGLETLVPLHRLDRRTAGVLAFGIRPEERSAYQQLFARGEVDKEYEARTLPELGSSLPSTPGTVQTLRDHLVKRHGELTAQVLEEPPNAESEVELLEVEGEGVHRFGLRPRTGRTHQLRLQLASRGAPILGEDLYWPAHRPLPPARLWPQGLPLQLLARTLAFRDPITGEQREFRSTGRLGVRGDASRTLGP